MNIFKCALSVIVILAMTWQSSCGGGSDSNVSRSVSGSLSVSDSSDNDYYYDLIPIGSVTAGKTVEIEAIPDGFDLYLALVDSGDYASGSQYDYADFNYTSEEENLNYTFDETHQAWIFVSSYEPGEVGDYIINYTIQDSDEEAEASTEESAVADSDDESCHGFSTSCSSISGYSGNCSNQAGCYLGFESDGYGGNNPVCKGSSYSCSSRSSESRCENQRGCSWY